MLLIALWMRSYLARNVIESPIGRSASCRIFNSQGSIAVVFHGTHMPWRFVSYEAVLFEIIPAWLPSMRTVKPGEPTLYSVSHAFAVMSIAVLAALPWLRWRFSLRTLLIGMTLVAVMLGLVVLARR
jgi:hypothetical protein